MSMVPTHRWARVLVFGPVLALLAGCQLVPQRPIPEPDPPAVQPARESSGPVRLVDAMDALQRGEFEEAAGMLAALRQASPGSPTLTLLARQLEESPEALLPGPYRTLRVAPGDTLSEIAAREVGNPLLFVALARLNGVDQPRRLAVGAELRVPQDSASPAEDQTGDDALAEPAVAAVEAGEVIGQDDASPEARRSELETVAEYLLASGQPTDARELLLAAARDRELSPAAEDLLVELSLDSARTEVEADQFDAAVATLAEATAVLAPGPGRARLEVRRTRVEVFEQLARAEAFERRGLVLEAYAEARSALDRDPDYAAAQAREAELREALVADYHDRALRAWRSRDIDLAIRTWDELLEAVPEFEPARVYLDRARQLRRRLDAPE